MAKSKLPLNTLVEAQDKLRTILGRRYESVAVKAHDILFVINPQPAAIQKQLLAYVFRFFNWFTFKPTVYNDDSWQLYADESEAFQDYIDDNSLNIQPFIEDWPFERIIETVYEELSLFRLQGDERIPTLYLAQLLDDLSKQGLLPYGLSSYQPVLDAEHANQFYATVADIFQREPDLYANISCAFNQSEFTLDTLIPWLYELITHSSENRSLAILSHFLQSFTDKMNLELKVAHETKAYQDLFDRKSAEFEDLTDLTNHHSKHSGSG